MILPLRHDQSEVRRWPWVSFGIMALCFVTFLFTDTSEYQEPPTPDEYLEQAADYWREHAYLDAKPEIVTRVGYDVMPNQRKQYLALMVSQARDSQPLDPTDLTLEQAELDRLTSYGLGLDAPSDTAQADHPFYRFGFVPSKLNLVGLVTHIFMHAGWIHLFGNLFMFFLAGPAIEDRIGRPAFAAFFLLSGIFSGAFWGMLTPYSDAPLVGASGAIAGTMGAFLVRYGMSEIRFAYFFLAGLRPIYGTFAAPAWLMLPIWFFNEIVQAWFDRSIGGASGVAYEAHIGGFLFGAAAMFAARHWKFEERFVDDAIEEKITLFKAHPAIEEAADLRQDGRHEDAFAMLLGAWDESPTDAALGLALWDAAKACSRAHEVTEAMCKAITLEVKAGDPQAAIRGWWEMYGLFPDVFVESDTMVRLLPTLQQDESPERTLVALRQIVDPDNTSTSPAHALRILETARSLDPPSALRAVRRALESPNLHETKREKLEAVAAELEGEGVEVRGRIADEIDHSHEEAEAAASDRSITIEEDEWKPPPPPPNAVPARTAFDVSGDDGDFVGDPLAADEPLGLDPLAEETLMSEYSSLPPLSSGSTLPPISNDAHGSAPPPPPDARPGHPSARTAQRLPLPPMSNVLDPTELPAEPDEGLGVEPQALPSLPTERAAAAAQPPPLPPEAMAAPVERAAEVDDLDFDELSPVDPMPRFSDVKVADAKPTALESDALRLELAGGRAVKLDFSKIQAVALAAVDGLSARPVLVIDLVLNWLAVDDTLLRTVRLRSDGFDPRRLVPGEAKPLVALRALLKSLVAGSGAVALPEANVLEGGAPPRYESLQAYERTVLDVDR